MIVSNSQEAYDRMKQGIRDYVNKELETILADLPDDLLLRFDKNTPVRSDSRILGISNCCNGSSRND